ncbi:MAG: hypothetical protein U9R50_12430 [Campylobacterota bacterium]|nr:hypothetical protein [Campylobacterota bacterium]
MQFNGKILFYNESDGKGIIITKEHEKYDFHVGDWNDFEIFPQVGLDVTCKIEDKHIYYIAPNNSSDKLATDEASAEEEHDDDNSLALWEKDRSKIDKIRLSVSVKVCVDQYFKQIEDDINKRTGYRNAKHHLDFLKMRRFLYTMYNNLTELDMHFITPRIKIMRDDLLEMSQVYDDFKSKATYPDIAFEKVFLNRQDEYIMIRSDAEVSFGKLGGLRETEGRLSDVIGEKEEVLERTLRISTQFDRLDDEHKELKSDYVDTVHMMASLDEEYHHDLELMLAFEQTYKEEFFERFKEASSAYRDQIVGILDAQAFLFDEQLWMQAQRSRVIQSFFQESHIQGEYCSKTFLKYYLNSLDQDKVSQEQKELFKLYEYLESLHRTSIIVLVDDMDKVFHFKALFSKITIPLDSQVFMDSKKAFAWLQKHPVNLVIVTRSLDKINAESFIHQFKEKIGSRAKTVLLGAEKGKLPEIFDAMMDENIRAGQFKEELEKLLKDDNG